MTSFDPYLHWLGIPVHEQPPHFYRLLGLVLFESNSQAIEQAADRQSLRVAAHQGGPQGELCQRVLSEIAMARFNLLDPQQKANYDAHLQQTLSQRGELAVPAPPPPAGFGAHGPPPATPTANREVSLPSPPLPVSPAPPATYANYAAPPGMSRFAAAQPLPSPPVPIAQPAAPQPMMPYPQPPSPVAFRAPMAVPVAIPVAAPVVAAPFPVSPRADGRINGAMVAAPPTQPPAPPPRPIDELESLASNPATRRRLAKKRYKQDRGKEVIIGIVVVAAVVVLAVLFIVNQSQNHPAAGFQRIAEDANSESVPLVPKSTADKAKGDAVKTKTSAHAATSGLAKTAGQSHATQGDSTPMMRNPKPAHPAETTLFGLPTTETPQPFETAPAADTQRHDSPQNLGDESDPVFAFPKEAK